MNILILEDDSIVIKRLIEDLKEHKLTITENSKTAIDLIKNNDYDIIYLDDRLDYSFINGSGYDVVDFLHKNKLKKPEIIIYSHNKHFFEYAFSLLDKVHHIPIKYTLDVFFW